MFVIVEIAGQQFKVKQDQQLYVHRLEGKEGDVVTFDRVLLSDNGSVTVGAPVIDGLAVEAKILEHLKGDKVIVFKKKRRKGYKKKNGHRQYLSKIEIVSIGAGSSKKSSKKEEKEAPKAKVEKVEKAPEAKATKVEKESKVAEKTESAPKKAKSAKGGDDLTKIEGIGPKVATIFNEAGITSYAELAQKSEDDLRALLEPHGGRYAGMNPSTWPQQADLAANDKWDELNTLQDELKGGV